MTSPASTEQLEVLSGDNLENAKVILAKYPHPRSAVLPLLFLVQAVEGWVTDAGMRDVGRLVGITPAQVLATGSFYTMLKKRPQGEYLISICRNITCTHMGARQVIADVETKLGIKVGETTPDGRFSLETAECLATCDGGPAAQINYEDLYEVTSESMADMIDTLAEGDGYTTPRGQRVKSSKEISLETAMSGAGLDALGDFTARTVSGEVLPADMAPGTRPKVRGVDEHERDSDEASAGDIPTDAHAESSQGSPDDESSSSDDKGMP